MKPSRAMIPGEILCSLVGIVLAYFGGIYDGWLHDVLNRREGAGAWLVMLGIPALAALYLGVREIWYWRHWGSIRQEQSARWRARAVLIQGLCQLYAVYFCFVEGIDLIGSLGVVLFGFCAWSYLENRRTCREIRYATSAALR